MKVLQKIELKDGYYYSGYIDQHYTVLTDQQQIVGMWDMKNNCFWFWEFEANRKSKARLNYLPDIDNEIENGFYPVKQVFPKEEHLIEV